MGDSTHSSLEQRPGHLFVLRETILIEAPIDRCFLLSTSVAIVREELRMKPVAGRTDGLVQPGDQVRWEGWQLGFWNYHVSLIARYDRPTFFQDRMLAGRFAFFEHDHNFREERNGTRLEDELRFSMPFGALGAIAGRFVMVPHIRTLMRERFQKLKGIAETDRWREYLKESDLASLAASASPG